MGTKVSAAASAGSKSSRAAVTEAIEGKVATAFSKSAKTGGVPKPGNKGNNKKDIPIILHDQVYAPVIVSLRTATWVCSAHVGDFNGREGQERLQQEPGCESCLPYTCGLLSTYHVQHAQLRVRNLGDEACSAAGSLNTMKHQQAGGCV